jgi:predicted RNA-binding Zn-ribbon protein involved in translation (DUF1610 family)
VNRTKQIKSFGYRVQAAFFLAVLIGFGGFMIVPEPYLWLWTGVFALSVGGSIILGERRIKAFVCPDCGTSISSYMDTEEKLDAPIQYFCHKCNVVWDTNLRTLDE